MPIFFNALSHVWIVYLLLINGLLLTWYLRSFSDSFRELTSPLESQVLSALVLSIGLNGFILLILEFCTLKFSLAIWPLMTVSFVITGVLFITKEKVRSTLALSFEIDFRRVILYMFVFVTLFYNGGLIEQIADSWWHMSLANKISIENTFSPSIGHLTGLSTRYYPPLWHANLALMTQLSDIPIAVFWNSFTAWGAVIKVMAFYLVALGLTKNKCISVIAALLFVLLPGVGVSYLRVSAWPSHIAYIAWYAMFYVTFHVLDKLPERSPGIKQGAIYFIINIRVTMAVLVVLSIIIYFTHKAEILWFTVAWFCYLISASISRLFGPREYIVDRDHIALRGAYLVGILSLLATAGWFAIKHKYPVIGFSDRVITNTLPIFILLVLFFIEVKVLPRALNICLVLGLFALLLISVNYIHLYSLFFPEHALPKGKFFESSSVAIGYFGGELKVPNWQLQLRSGLLYSAIISVVVGYLYHWLQSILAYHSPWRISLIIFHPILWALVIIILFDVVRGELDEKVF